MENGPFFTDDKLTDPVVFAKIGGLLDALAKLRVLSTQEYWDLRYFLAEFEYDDYNEEPYFDDRQLLQEWEENPTTLLTDKTTHRDAKRATAKKVKRYALVHKRKLIKSRIKRDDESKNPKLENARRSRSRQSKISNRHGATTRARPYLKKSS